MQLLRTVTYALIMGLAAIQVAGCAGGPKARAAGEFTEDAALTARVKTALAREAGVSTATNVDVTTYRGVVQLSGFVNTEADAQRAVATARKVEGVVRVHNDLIVAPAPRR